MNDPSKTDTIVNIAMQLKKSAARLPYKRAVVAPGRPDRLGRVPYTHLTFTQLDEESDRLAHGIKSVGITKGTRTILMVTPSIEFFALTFALFKTGAVPVVVDPGMGLKRMVDCLAESQPEAFIGIPKAHVLRILYPKFFKSVKTWITVGHRWFWRGHTLDGIRPARWQPFAMATTRRDDMAAILFTTGSTGPAKGTIYTHGNFDGQIRHIQEHFEIADDEIDLPTFPLFALFDPALGMTAVIPDMDPTRPAMVNPQKIITPIMDHGVTNMFASPALLNRVGKYGKENGVKLPSLRRVVSAGAPVSPANIEQFSTMLESHAEVHTPYGATEAVPIVSIGSREILAETRKKSEQGYGMCVGRALSGVDVDIIRISDEPITRWSDDLAVPDGGIGEIVVRADHVTRGYYRQPRADALSKIADGNGGFWHRMGDLGWRDSKGRIWFCGRKSHRVETADGTLYTIPCEAIFNNHPAVFRSALVGVGKPKTKVPVILIEVAAAHARTDRESLADELLEMARDNPLTRNIRNVLFHPSFPVDIRHNSKIFREQLTMWAAGRLGKKGGGA